MLVGVGGDVFSRGLSSPLSPIPSHDDAGMRLTTSHWVVHLNAAEIVSADTGWVPSAAAVVSGCDLVCGAESEIRPR